jgi:hypothetical protein
VRWILFDPFPDEKNMKTLALLAVAAVVIACDAAQAPTAPHARPLAPVSSSAAVVVNDRFEANTFAPDNCNGGGIFLQADWHQLFALTFDGAGGVHVKQHINIQGQGSDPATGVRYAVNEALNDEFNAEVGQEETYTIHYNLIAKGNAPNAYLFEDFHITVNANGGVTSYHDHFRIECQ